jgi:hypothetical protein
MAKIIDFKTREVLADLPTETKTPRRVLGFKIEGVMNYLGIISRSPMQAHTILLNAQIAHNVAKHFERQPLKGA